MNATIHVELPCSGDANDLVAFLAGSQLAGALTPANDREIDVRYAVDADERLCHDLDIEIGNWLAARRRPLIPVKRNSRSYVLRPPAD